MRMHAQKCMHVKRIFKNIYVCLSLSLSISAVVQSEVQRTENMYIKSENYSMKYFMFFYKLQKVKKLKKKKRN